ncbi:hypothetical protein DSO57_1019565 [Entomophthora muscae]|uniref:Uncharacterized protein n=1 Tax=Entomophthora muscae TaxID=34485 RepID=A0ACC2RV05_9FUNG|nr:hypothetical protein DSO57_1019565 [Entomophthora muscae]
MIQDGLGLMLTLLRRGTNSEVNTRSSPLLTDITIPSPIKIAPMGQFPTAGMGYRSPILKHRVTATHLHPEARQNVLPPPGQALHDVRLPLAPSDPSRGQVTPKHGLGWTSLTLEHSNSSWWGIECHPQVP